MTETDTREGQQAGPERTIPRGDPAYPARLERLADPPPLLHLRGSIPAGPMVGVVGTRQADAAALRFATNLSGELAERGLTVVSGGALGVDTAAHEGALDAGGTTVAVIGSGLASPYPPGNAALFDRIAASGALLSELPPDAPPTRWTFPRRNRLVAALAGAVVVVQAGTRSGALITARLAGELGVPVGAVPGAPDDPRNRGSNRLLRGGATLIEGADDVVALLGEDLGPRQMNLPIGKTRSKGTAPGSEPELTEAQSRILELLGARPVHIDEIASAAGLGAAEISAAMIELELAGLAREGAGKTFVRMGGATEER